ncbi:MULTISPECIES: epoxyqueuosine reductase QueH [Thermodesulfovibrio]|uniref:epoxyqueuosine reductase QueH n=1 Tax=Thermodesulfovibrio TaxID=28261 RepID=UPI003457CD06
MLFFHICCDPCSLYLTAKLRQMGISFKGFFIILTYTPIKNSGQGWLSFKRSLALKALK